MVCKHREEIIQLLDECSCCDEEPPTGCHPEYIGQGPAAYSNDKPVPAGEQFDHTWYLSTYKDVAAHADCYATRPYAHYFHHGKAEGRKPGPSQSPPPPEPTGVVRVEGNKIIGVDGKPVFLKIGGWFNFLELDGGGNHTVTGQQIRAYMDYCNNKGINCLLFKAGYWLVQDDGITKNQEAIDFVHHLVVEAERRGIYIILNIFDTWNRERGSRKFNTHGPSQVFNVWSDNDVNKPNRFVAMITSEFMIYPRVIFELGNEMAHSNNVKIFKRNADSLYLKQFYITAGATRPIGCSESTLWPLKTNVVFNHDPNLSSVVGPNDRPIVTNELAHGSGLWRDEYIRSSNHTNRYLEAFQRAKNQGYSGVCAASGIKLHTPYNTGPVNQVLTALGQL